MQNGATLTVEELLGPETGPVSPPATGREGESGVVASPDSPVMIAGDAYEAASRTNQEVARWQPSMGSADADIIPGKDLLDARGRDILRNDAYASAGDSLHRDSIVGAQYVLNLKPETRILFGREDDVWETEYQEEVEAKFRLACDSPFNWFDASRTCDFTQLVRLAVGVHLAGGEVLTTAEWMPDDGRPFRTAVQMVDTARLSDPQDRVYPMENVRGGVEVDRRGAPVAYYIRRAHPHDYRYAFSNGRPESFEWRRVAARKPWGRQMVFHCYEVLRPEQTRGISRMAGSLKETRMGKTFRDTVLQNAIVNATYAASIESEMPPDALAARLGGEDGVEGLMSQWMGAVNEYSAGAKNLSIGGVKIPFLPMGTKLQLRPAGQGGPLGTEFEQSILRYVASAFGVSYEQLSRDYTNTNYSSARASMAETWKFMQARKKMVADRFANFVFRLWLEEAINKGQIESLKMKNPPNWYEGLNAEALTSCEWIGAGRGQIDEMKETQAAILRMKNGLSTAEHEIARMHGGDYRRVFRQMKREQELRDELSLPALIEDTQTMEKALTKNPSEGGGNA